MNQPFLPTNGHILSYHDKPRTFWTYMGAIGWLEHWWLRAYAYNGWQEPEWYIVQVPCNTFSKFIKPYFIYVCDDKGDNI